MQIVLIRSNGEIQYGYMSESDIIIYDRFVLRHGDSLYMILYSAQDKESPNEIGTLLAPPSIRKSLPDGSIHGNVYVSLVIQDPSTQEYHLVDTDISPVIALYAQHARKCRSECNIL